MHRPFLLIRLLLLGLAISLVGCPTRTDDDDDDTADDDDAADDDDTPEGEDVDGDGYCAASECIDTELEGGDCDDRDDTVYPGADELCDQKDNDCDDRIDENFDADQDGYVDRQGSGCALAYPVEELDCNDLLPTVFPGAAELCDGLDNDCNGRADDGLDEDRDGFLVCLGDCDDDNDNTYPGALEICDEEDNNCNGTVDDGGNGVAYDQQGDDFEDGDLDGYTPCQGDCNDRNLNTFPGATEACDDEDNDCDDDVDEDVDGDGDGWPGDFPGCFAAFGELDCDDADDTVYPGAPELCDLEDNNCNGTADENLDFDNDGFTSCEGDCQPLIAAVNPSAFEDCDGIDNNCDGTVDNGWDQDGDGNSPCGPGADCDDSDPATYVGATPVCGDGQTDNNCDGSVDLIDQDIDGDGETDCDGDCDDSDAAVNTSAIEVCNAIDDDCDGVVPADEADDDNDGFLVCTPAGCQITLATYGDNAAYWSGFAGLGPLGLDTPIVNDASGSGWLLDSSHYGDGNVIILAAAGQGLLDSEYTALNGWVAAGGHLIVTGLDALTEVTGSDEAIDALADLVYSAGSGPMSPPTDLCTVSNSSTPLTSGTYGSFGLNTTFTASSTNHDNAIADLSQYAIRVASVGSKAKIIYKDVLGLGGSVTFWNGDGKAEWEPGFNADLQDMLLNLVSWANIGCSPLGLTGGDCDDSDPTAVPGTCP